MVDISAIKKGQGGKKEAVKTVKFKLTKEQASYVENAVKLENRIIVCREYIALWTHYFRFFCDDLPHKEITAEDEKGFFQIATTLARKHFLFVELMGDCFERGPDVINLLGTGTSLSSLQGMQENTLSKFELDWHTLFLDMNKALGRLVRLLPGTMTVSDALAALDKGHSTKTGAPPKGAAAKK